MKRSLVIALFALLAVPALGQRRPPNEIEGVGIDQRLEAPIPLDATFVDSEGKTVRLGDLLRGKPVILTLVYYRCPMLCNLVLEGLLSTLRPLTMSVGDEFDVITVSFDASEGPELAAAKRRAYLDSYERTGAESGWHFLTGDQAAIDALTQAVGFRYRWDEETQQFAHGSAIVVLTPEGLVSRYFYGIEFQPRDLRLGLVEASRGEIGSAVDQILLLCFQYDPATGRYGFVINGFIRGAGLLTVLMLAIFITRTLLHERRQRRASQPT